MEIFAWEGKIVGDVVRCRAAQSGTVTAKVIFWARHPQSTMLDEMSLLVVTGKFGCESLQRDSPPAITRSPPFHHHQTPASDDLTCKVKAMKGRMRRSAVYQLPKEQHQDRQLVVDGFVACVDFAQTRLFGGQPGVTGCLSYVGHEGMAAIGIK